MRFQVDSAEDGNTICKKNARKGQEKPTNTNYLH